MSAVTFDTLKFVSHLIASGISEDHAKAIVEAQKESLAESLETQLATKSDINELKLEINEVRSEIKLVKWMIALVIVFNVLPILKTMLSL